ncbi:MAG: flagellar hook-length control protein FliK [Candidatus Desulfofervidaceae bacterium]|nr:flagellar hook-length control protein FliK [Candidatus Desulfofervidaceae bacterium]
MRPFRVLSSPELIQISREEDREIFSRIGQVLKAQVVERLSENRFFLKFGERLILAETTMSLKEGESIQVRVEALRPRIVLKLLPSEDTVNTSARLLIKNLILKDLASFWTKLLGNEYLSVGVHPLVSDLHQMMNSLLADTNKLKQKRFWQYLSRMLLGNPEKDEGSPLQKNLFALLEFIGEKEDESKQLVTDFLNHFMSLKEINHRLKQDGVYLQVPYMWSEGPKTVEIFIGKEKSDKKSGGEGKVYFIHFRLELASLKRIEVILRLEGENSLFVDFKVESGEVAQLMLQEAQRLKKMLVALNFQIKDFRCEPMPKEYWKDFCLNWVDLKEGLVDMKA